MPRDGQTAKKKKKRSKKDQRDGGTAGQKKKQMRRVRRPERGTCNKSRKGGKNGAEKPGLVWRDEREKNPVEAGKQQREERRVRKSSYYPFAKTRIDPQTSKRRNLWFADAEKNEGSKSKLEKGPEKEKPAQQAGEFAERKNLGETRRGEKPRTRSGKEEEFW